jgi:hypothetical protein
MLSEVLQGNEVVVAIGGWAYSSAGAEDDRAADAGGTQECAITNHEPPEPGKHDLDDVDKAGSPVRVRGAFDPACYW